MTDRRPIAAAADDADGDRSFQAAGVPRNDAAGPEGWVRVELDDAMADVGAPRSVDGRERAARSLFQTRTLGAVLTNLAAGASMENEGPDEPATILGIRGECRIALEREAVEVGRGTFVAVPAGIAWRLDAISDATVLVTVAHPRS